MNKLLKKSPKPRSELQKISMQYGGLLWQLKGNLGALKGMQYRIHKQDTLPIPDSVEGDPIYYKNKVNIHLTIAIASLEAAEYFIGRLSASHRAAYKRTQQIAKTKPDI